MQKIKHKNNPNKRSELIKAAKKANNAYLTARESFLNDDIDQEEKIRLLIESLKAKMNVSASKVTFVKTWQDDIKMEYIKKIILSFDKYDAEKGQPMQLIVTIINNINRDWIGLRQKRIKNTDSLCNMCSDIEVWEEIAYNVNMDEFYKTIDANLGFVEENEDEDSNNRVHTRPSKRKQGTSQRSPRYKSRPFIT
jgi:hypothetical protein